jgi:hypothetical protein
MCSPMLAAQAEATGASLGQGGCSEICSPVHETYEAKFNPLHMTWVLIDRTNGNPRLHTRWVVER